MKEHIVGAFFSLEELFGEEAVKKARRKMLNITPSDMDSMVVFSLPLVMVVGFRYMLFLSFFYCVFFTACFYGCSMAFSTFS